MRIPAMILTLAPLRHVLPDPTLVPSARRDLRSTKLQPRGLQREIARGLFGRGSSGVGPTVEQSQPEVGLAPKAPMSATFTIGCAVGLRAACFRGRSRWGQRGIRSRDQPLRTRGAAQAHRSRSNVRHGPCDRHCAGQIVANALSCVQFDRQSTSGARPLSNSRSKKGMRSRRAIGHRQRCGRGA